VTLAPTEGHPFTVHKPMAATSGTQASTPLAAKAVDSTVDSERLALLEKPSVKRKSWWPFKGAIEKHDPCLEEWDSTQYDITQMTSWRAFSMVHGCAWANPVLWACIGVGALLAIAVAALTIAIPSSGRINPTQLAKLSTFLNVFVGLLLGFFLTSSMNRWYGCVTAFMELLDAVRSMQMQMTALGVDHDRSMILSRYGILSAWLLHLSLNIDSDDGDPSDEQSEKITKVWQKLEEFRPQLVRPEEKEQLMPHKESYALLWTWVASLIGRMSQDGEIPPMASPTYGRILNIVQQAYGSIRNVRALQMVRAPFIYIHTLCILVHVNNILNAISLGVVLGIWYSGTVLSDAETRATAADMQMSLFMQFCYSMLAPVLYLALLDMSVCISQPFNYHYAKIPAIKFIRSLEEDLQKAASLGESPPLWEKPSFQKK